MARSIINNDAVSGETFLLGQLFVFGGFALRANSIGHLEQIDSYAPGHQIRFRNRNYVANIGGDLIFEGFTASPTIPCLQERNPSDPLSSTAQGPNIIPSLALDPKQTTSSEDGNFIPTGLSSTMELLAGDPEATLSSASL